MKKLSFLLLLSAFLASCGQEIVPQTPPQVSPVKTEVSVPVVEKEITPIVKSNSGVTEQSLTGAVSSSGSTNEVSFSDAQIQDILAKIDANTKAQQEVAKNATGVLVQGDYRAEYLPSKDNVDDKIKIIVNGKESFINLDEININNKKVNDLYHKGECREENNDLPKCTKSKFGRFYQFYNNGAYLGYFKQAYEAGALIIVSVNNGKELYNIFDASSCSMHLGNLYLTCDYYRGDGELGIYSLATGKNSIIGTNVNGNSLDDKYVYTKEGTILKIYSLSTLKEVFSKEIK